jgi:hypothetical protein
MTSMLIRFASATTPMAKRSFSSGLLSSNHHHLYRNVNLSKNVSTGIEDVRCQQMEFPGAELAASFSLAVSSPEQQLRTMTTQPTSNLTGM